MDDLNTPQDAVDDFAARFGSAANAYLDLARHAALPLALTPDLLYLIWFNFRSDEQELSLHIPWLAVADLLLSHLCQEISRETYAMSDGVRHLLLQQMLDDDRFGLPRVQRLALFLDQYAERQLNSDNPYTQEAGQAQRLAAYAYANPRQLVDYLAQVYQQPLPQTQMVRFDRLMASLQYPVANGPQTDGATKLTFAQAQTVGSSLAEWARGNVDAAVNQLRDQFADGLTIAGVPVALPDEVQQALSGWSVDPENGSGTAIDSSDLAAFFDNYLDSSLFDDSPRLSVALNAIGRWLVDSSQTRMLLITGQPGSGKMKLAVNYLKQHPQGNTPSSVPEEVGAYHFCMADRPETLNARLFVRNVQQQLTRKPINFQRPLPEDPDRSDLPFDLWLEEQLIDPLRSVLTIKPVYSKTSQADSGLEKLVLVVANVDAATQHKDGERILDVCLRLADELPGLRLLLTTELSTVVRDAIASQNYTYFTLDTVYRNFDLNVHTLSSQGDRWHEARVLNAPTGVSSSPLTIHVDAEDRIVSGVLRALSSITAETQRQPIGGELFQAFFADEIRQLFETSLAQVQQVGERLRLRLFLAGSDYVALPWEWLYDEKSGFLVQQPEVSLVRYGEQASFFRTHANPQPVNVLFASAMPKSGRAFPAAEMAAGLEKSAVAQSGRIAFTTMQNTSRQQLEKALTSGSVHVLHLAVAVENDSGAQQLMFEAEGRPEPMATVEVARYVEQCELGLVVLSAVAEDQRTAVLQAAESLVAEGVPAAVALPTLLQPAFMVQGIAALLDQLAEGAWLDTAVANTRKTLVAQPAGDAAGLDLALFTGTEHGNIWRSEITAVDLYEALADGFTLAELQTLCFELEIDFNTLTGEGRRGKMVSLVREIQKRNRVQELALALLNARPNTKFAYRRHVAGGDTDVPAGLLDEQILQRIIEEQFNLEEIRILCFELALEFEDLPGQRKSEKVRELILLTKRQKKLPTLAATVVRQRPHLRQEIQTGSEDTASDPVGIFRILAERFTLDELRVLAFDLEINLEDLGGETLPAKARELVLWCQRHALLPELVQAIQQARDLPPTLATAKEAAAKLPISYDPQSQTVFIYGQPQQLLTPLENRLFQLLHARGNDVVTKSELINAGWSEAKGGVSDEALTAAMARLRKKIEPDPTAPRFLETVFNQGYRLHLSPTTRGEASVKRLRQALEENFDSDELRTVSFELDIDYENLIGGSRKTKVMALVEYAQRHNRLQDLTQVMQRARPQLDLGGFEDPK